MTDEELEQTLDEMLEHFGSLPSPVHEPKRFAMAVKMFKYYRKQKDESLPTVHDLTNNN